jgi:hypothetical protein
MAEVLTNDAKRCSCGRSPTGYCLGWHGLSEEELRKKIEENAQQLLQEGD